ncbi:hypothetical protein DL96DRAFT_1810623 [Flagelloscypha sp. PMI_526]|nr:hypothetical protein DL96DRAFT_1810623 [Flagelloscypha sp. PMI_526]
MMFKLSVILAVLSVGVFAGTTPAYARGLDVRVDCNRCDTSVPCGGVGGCPPPCYGLNDC